jgi:thymidylate synthase (FAD)
MKLIKQSYEFVPQALGLEGIYKQIEKAGRICYKSEDKITEDSAKDFVNRMVKSKHHAMLEHGTVYLHMEFDSKKAFFNNDLVLKYLDESHTKVFRIRDIQTEPQGKQHAYITTNYRVLVENNWLDDLKYLCEPTEYHEKRITIKFTTNIGISREFTRHRVFSYAVESTRYCNYSKSKFNNEITYIQPWWIPESRIKHYFEYQEQQLSNSNWMVDIEDGDVISTYLEYLENIENYYLYLLNINKLKPEQARGVLPLDTKCDMIMTGFVSDWKHFFDLRALGTTGAPHPQAKELAEPLMKDFKKLNLL